MGLLKESAVRVVKDFKKKELWPLKLIFFLKTSTLYVLYPYFTVHMRQLGINVEETAIMSAITPVIAILMPPLAGMFADKLGNFKILLALLSALTGIAALLLLLVPVGRIQILYPAMIPMMLSCNSASKLYLNSFESKYTCEQNLDNLNRTFEMSIPVCGLTCRMDTPEILDAVLRTTRRINIEKLDGKGIREVHRIKYRKYYDVFEADLSAMTYLQNKIALENEATYMDRVRQASHDHIFFPSDIFDFNCDSDSGWGQKCSFEYQDNIAKTSVTAGELNTMIGQGVRNGLTMDHTMPVMQVGKKDALGEPFCQQVTQQNKLFVELDNDTIILPRCQIGCVASVPRKDVCTNIGELKDININFTFWTYLGIRVLVGVVSGTAFAMFEGAVIAILREHKADYGMQRIYATIGGMISSPFSGLMIDYFSAGQPYVDFRPAFALYFVLKLASSVLILFMDLEFKEPAKSITKDLLSVLRHFQMTALLISCFILGAAWGFIESFLFWLIDDLGGKKSLMGVTVTVAGIAGIPLLIFSGPIVNKIGHANVIFIGFIFYAIRLFGYSIITEPWQCLIFESMESVTGSLAITASVTYGAKLSSLSTDSSIQGLIGGLYYGVGKGAGGLSGGYLIKYVGYKMTYRIFSGVCLITGLIYFVINFMYFKRKHLRAQQQPDPEVTPASIRKPLGIETGTFVTAPGASEINGNAGNVNLAFDASKEPEEIS